MAKPTKELEQLARAHGVLTSYEDVSKRPRRASVESLLGVLNALGVDVKTPDDARGALESWREARQRRGVEPAIVVWDRAATPIDLTVPKQHATRDIEYTIESEAKTAGPRGRLGPDLAAPKPSDCGQFVTRRLQLPGGLDWGFHRLSIEAIGGSPASGRRRESGPTRHASTIISAPTRAYAGEYDTARNWGCFLPLYALRSDRNWGAGDFTDLENLTRWTASLGGHVVGTLPLLAAYLDEPCEPSPYAPASRLAWNDFYIDVARIPELADCPAAAERLRSATFLDAVTQFRQAEHVDYRRIMAWKREILQILADFFFERKPAERFAQFQRFLGEHRRLEDYAEFRATHERRREPWSEWPEPLRDGQLSTGDYDPRAKQYHLYAQWIASEQLESLTGAASGGLYLDLPLGVRQDGYDVWRWRDQYASAASAGAPPDSVWTKGQDWCFPALHPERIRENGYQHVRDYLAHHLRLARLLRIDHVMQLHRLYWIPRGLRADQGAYVRYRADEFYAVLNLESHRCQATLIGENLGTVPPEVDQAMDRHNMKRMYVVQYEVADTAPGKVFPGSVASLNTHDMPNFAAWWRGADVPIRQKLGLIDQAAADRELLNIGLRGKKLTDWLRSQGWLDQSSPEESDILKGILKFLALSDASLVIVNLEDLWLETRPQNVPGTGPELPNWRRGAAHSYEEFTRLPNVSAALRDVSRSRQCGTAPISSVEQGAS